MLTKDEIELVEKLIYQWQPRGTYTIYVQEDGQEREWDSNEIDIIEKILANKPRVHPAVLLAEMRNQMSATGLVTALRDVRNYLNEVLTAKEEEVKNAKPGRKAKS